jgi:hypothetical protein
MCCGRDDRERTCIYLVLYSGKRTSVCFGGGVCGPSYSVTVTYFLVMPPTNCMLKKAIVARLINNMQTLHWIRKTFAKNARFWWQVRQARRQDPGHTRINCIENVTHQQRVGPLCTGHTFTLGGNSTLLFFLTM